MTNPNTSANPLSSLPSVSLSPAMARLRALQQLRASNQDPPAVPKALDLVIKPVETEEEVDWESLFAASTKKETSELPDTNPTPTNFNVKNTELEADNLFLVDELNFSPPAIQEDNAQKIIQEQISQSLPNISTPEIADSSDFFTPPFEVLESIPKLVNLNPQPIPILVDQIKLNPEVLEPESNQLKITQSTGSYPLTLTEDPTHPNPITQMLKKLQGQFGSRISDTMRKARENIKKTTAQFKNKPGDASSLESSLFGN